MSSKMSKIVLGPVNTRLVKQQRKKDEIERIKQEVYQNLLRLKIKYNMTKEEFLDAIKYMLSRYKC